MNDPSTFRVRSYSKTELALLYFPKNSPHTALRHLMRMINRCRFLTEALAQTGYTKSDRIFSPKQVRLIVEHLDPPGPP